MQATRSELKVKNLIVKLYTGFEYQIGRFLNRFFMDDRIFISVESALPAQALVLLDSLFLKIETVDDLKVSTPYKLIN